MLSRRNFLKAGALGASAYFLPQGSARAAGSNNVLVVIYQFGGADGLNIVIPRGDPEYYSLRPTIGVPPGTELDLDPFFGLHPSWAPLQPLYQSGDLALIHAAGSPDPSRSHFDSQDYMERGAPGDKTVTSGWLNRYLLAAGSGNSIQGVTLSDKKAKGMLGPASTVAFKSISSFGLTGSFTTERRAAIQSLYAPLTSLLGGGVNEALSAVDLVAGVDTTTAVVYPGGGLGNALRDTAALIKADIGIRVVMVPIGGWDHHSDIDVRMAASGDELASGMAAFYQDLGACQSTTLTICMTEFGRRPSENGSGGCDHGRGGVMMALGGGVGGGRVLLQGGAWPGLLPGDLYNGQDLQVTTDFRTVVGEALDRHMGFADPSALFPDYTMDSGDYPGLYV